MVGLGADHNGLELKDWLKAFLLGEGYGVRDFGTDTPLPVDYPDVAARVGAAVAGGEVERAILVCGTGLGMAIAANKIPGVYAAPVGDPTAACRARESNGANVIALGAWTLDHETAARTVMAWLEARFCLERSGRKVAKIRQLERRYARVPERLPREVPA